MRRDATIVLRLLATTEGGRKSPIPKGVFRGVVTFDGLLSHDITTRLHKELRPGESREVDIAFLRPELVASTIGLRSPIALVEGHPIGHGHVLAYSIGRAK